jgi:hypothetical protein
MKVRQAFFFIVSAIVGFMAASHRDAKAFLRRQGAMSCMFDPTQKSSLWSVNGNQLRWGASSDAGSPPTEPGRLFCPLLDDDSAPVRNLFWISFQGYDASPTDELKALICFTYESGVHTPGGNCDSAFVGSGSGHVGPVDLPLNATNFFGTKGTFDFPYVFVQVPAPAGSGISSFWGINWST